MSSNDNDHTREEGPRAIMHDEHSNASDEDSLHELPSPVDLYPQHPLPHPYPVHHEPHQTFGVDNRDDHHPEVPPGVPTQPVSTSPTREQASASATLATNTAHTQPTTSDPHSTSNANALAESQNQHQSHPPVAIYTKHSAGRKRAGSSASGTVPLDHFDPEGMHELRRTFTQQSRELRSQVSVGQLGRQPSRPEIRFEHGEPGRKVSGGESEGTGTVVSDELEEEEREQFDFEQKLKEVVTHATASNVITRQLGVVFRDLTVTGLGASASFAPTVGSLFNPLLIPEKLREARHPATRDILKGFEGVVWPGEMCLVLGRPGAGCSTLLKTLANQHGEYHDVSGFLHYANGISSSDVHNHFRGDVVYCEEDDVHFPTLTVEETLRFAARTKMPASTGRPSRITKPLEKMSSRLGGKKAATTTDPEKGQGEGPEQTLEPVSKHEFTEELVNTLCTVFGLRHVRKTKVGNAAIRGVSGGERKRVSIAEALATRARLGCWDNSTRGLDSSTALEFVRALRLATDNLGLTSLVSIYQASELLYALFDKVALIHSGRLIYFGPADTAKDYFVRMGYEKNDRTTTADYLVGVTDEIGRKVMAGYEGRVPKTVEEFCAYWEKSPECEALRAEVDRFITQHVPLSSHPPARPKPTPASKSKRQTKHLSVLSAESYPSKFADAPPSPTQEDSKKQNRRSYVQSAHAEHAKRSRRESPFVISIPRQIVEVMKRRVAIIKGDWTAQVILLLSFVFQAIIMGTIFFNMAEATSAYFSRGGVLFFAVLFGALSAMAEIPALFAQRPIVSRHAKSAMYHPFTEAMALTLVDIPITFFTLACFCIVVYFLAGLQRTAGQFFVFLLLVFSTTVMMKAFFRTLAAAFKREPGAQAVAGIAVLILVLYTGYTIPKPSMIGGLRWITYINPLRYAFEGILVNEFHSLDGTCSSLVPSGSGYENITLSNQVCSTVGAVSGSSTVNGNTFVELSYGYAYSNLWRNFGIVIAFGIFFIGFLLCLSEWNTASALDVGSIMYIRSKKGQRALTEDVESDPTVKVNTAAVPKDEEKTAAPTPTQTTGSGLSPARSKAEKEEQEKALESLVKTPDLFSWQNLEYTVPIGKGETRKLLDNISGYVSPGKLTALMGESGAGKTTLLNVLAGRTDTGVITGDRFVNGQGLPHDFQAQTGYCQQMDTHMPELTVRESLLFSAKLRQSQSVSLAEKEAYVETCLKMCGLEAQADAVVGSLGVEHRKRTTIGVELAAKPKLLLFLDEPTSGLDSQSAWAIMTFLRDLADHGQAILCTIHQPSNELFQVFDRLLLLKKGGQTVYFGDLGTDCKLLIEYFEANGGRKCEPHENPAEWMLDVIGAGATAQSNVDWREAWIRSSQAAAFREELENIHTDGRKRPPVPAAQKSDFAAPWVYQFYTNLIRLFTAYWRNPTYVMSKLFLNIAAGLLIGFTFFKAKDTIQGTQNKLFAIFMSTIVGVAAVNQLQIQWIDVRAIYEVRERPSRMYSWTALVASQILVELPYNFFCNSIYFLCWFWTVGFRTDRAGYTYLMISVLFPIYYTTIGQAVASMAPNALIASVLFSTLFSFVISFNGVLQPFRQLGWWKWMYHVSPFTYLIEGILGQAIGGVEVTCASDEYVSVDPPSGQTCSQFLQNYISSAGGYVSNPDATSGCEYCSVRTTDQFMGSSFNIFYSHHWRDLGIFAAFCLFNIFAVFALTYIFRIRKH